MDKNIKTFTEDLQMANKHVGRCSISLATREIQIKGTMKYHHMLTKILKMVTSNASEDIEKLDHSRIAGGNVKWSRHTENSLVVFFNRTKHIIAI